MIIEINVANGRTDKKELYERIGVREFWRYKPEILEAFALVDGKYISIQTSRVIDGLPIIEVEKGLKRGQVGDSQRAINATLKQWLRQNRRVHRPDRPDDGHDAGSC